ncbi:hypothetical protein B0J13DRAFT_622691 [Dactylonectria estremocensis]|uniref:Major facilitator superfamily (MFS) profile domain-containing protein n=1 Tax=Dactylonectria estremocensis TaxID=1079267 RepID=A0A9P9EPS2_9HYPO|nr:hypothetical protein B0J13DRAFT_622691 [Dactylonectria estremocensis]
MATREHNCAVNYQTSYLACFRGVDLRRTLISICIYCIQTLSGNPLRGYSTYFLQQSGLPGTQAFNMTIVGYSLALVGGFFTLNKTAWNWGANTDFFWAGGCLLSVSFIYFCDPETKDCTTAEMDLLFEGHISPRDFANTSVDLVEETGGQDEEKRL